MDNNDKKDGRINQILSHLASAATTAADGVTDVVHTAGQMVGEKYEAVKATTEMNRLLDEQNKLFADIGRAMFTMRVSAPASEESDAGVSETQHTIDRLMLLADQKQQEIDALAEKINKLTGDKACPACGNIASSKDVFCSACGAKLP